MTIYILKPDANRYQNFVPLKSDGYDILRKFIGTRFNEVWTPLMVEAIRDSYFNREQPPSDFPGLASHVPVFSQRAVDALRDILEENGQLFPVVCKDIVYFAYNVFSIENILDLNSSKVKRFKSSGRIMEIVEYEFFPDQLSSLTIFKLPETSIMDVFVTDKFVDRVKKFSLTGFRFEQIYPRIL